MCNIGNWKCQHCQDTGEVGQLGYLDCAHCNVAEERAALEAWIAGQDRMVERDLVWAAYKRGRDAGSLNSIGVNDV